MTHARLTVLSLVLALVSPLYAQEPDKAAVLGDAPPAVPAKFEAPRPAVETDQMRKWEGEWKTVATFTKGNMMPEGGEAKGNYKSARGLGGHAFIGDYKATGTGGDFFAHGVRTFDPLSKKWKTWWYDSWVPGHADVSIGEVAADGTFVTESDSEYQGNKFRTRITERWTDDNKVEQTCESDLGQGFVTVMTIVYTRKGKWKEKPAPKEKKPRKKDDEKSKGDEKPKDADPSKDPEKSKDEKKDEKPGKKGKKPEPGEKGDEKASPDKPKSEEEN